LGEGGLTNFIARLTMFLIPDRHKLSTNKQHC